MEGKYIDQEATQESKDDCDFVEEDDEAEHASIVCSIPNVTGRGFIEVLSAFVAEGVLYFPFLLCVSPCLTSF